MTCHTAMLEVRAVEVWRWEYLCYMTKISDHESDPGVSVWRVYYIHNKIYWKIISYRGTPSSLKKHWMWICIVYLGSDRKEMSVPEENASWHCFFFFFFLLFFSSGVIYLWIASTWWLLNFSVSGSCLYINDAINLFGGKLSINYLKELAYFIRKFYFKF